MRNIRNIKYFLWWIAGAEISVLEKLPSESNRFIGIGLSILMQTVLTFLSASIGIAYITTNETLIMLFAILWTVIEFNIIRLLISTYNPNRNVYSERRNNPYQLLINFIPRLFITSILALVIAQPLIIALFQHDIEAFGNYNSNISLMQRISILGQINSGSFNARITEIIINLTFVLLSVLPFAIKLFSSSRFYEEALRTMEEIQFHEFRRNAERSAHEERSDETLLNKIKEELDELKDKQDGFTQSTYERIVRDINQLNQPQAKTDLTSFDRYFHNIIDSITIQIEKINKNAVKIFYQGLLITFIGLGLYIGFIFFWLDTFQTKGFHEYHIFGVVSTSLLFLFIEFLGAWFLKQYKILSDLSTHLFKFKTVLDKYYLSYMVVKEFADEKNKNEIVIKLLDQLKDEIKIPGDLSGKFTTSFAKDTMESVKSLTEVVKKLTEK